MSAAGLLKYAYWAFLSKPPAERRLFRLIRRRKPTRIVELGIGSGVRGLRMISAAQRYAGDQKIQYTGVDLFELRDAGAAGLSLKQAHRQFKATGARVRLMPGDPYGALHEIANGLLGTDLLLIAHDQDAASLVQAWFYVPRMLHPGTVVLQERPAAEGAFAWSELSHAQIEGWARACATIRRRAA